MQALYRSCSTFPGNTIPFDQCLGSQWRKRPFPASIQISLGPEPIGQLPPSISLHMLGTVGVQQNTIMIWALTAGLIYPVTRVGQLCPWRSTSPTWPAGSRDFQSHLVPCAGTEHVQRNDKGFSMHPWQEKGLHCTFEKWRWAIIIRFNYSLEFHIKLTQAHTHTQAATNLLPVAAEKCHRVSGERVIKWVSPRYREESLPSKNRQPS